MKAFLFEIFIVFIFWILVMVMRAFGVDNETIIIGFLILIFLRVNPIT
jgi:hypothetical protein